MIKQQYFLNEELGYPPRNIKEFHHYNELLRQSLDRIRQGWKDRGITLEERGETIK